MNAYDLVYVYMFDREYRRLQHDHKFQDDTSIPDRRVLIGTFMTSRTNALGGMSEEVSADSRPTFDYKAVSPPGGHQLRSLLPPSLLDLSETDECGPCIANDMSSQNAHTDIAARCWLYKNELLDVLSLETVLHRPPDQQRSQNVSLSLA